MSVAINNEEADKGAVDNAERTMELLTNRLVGMAEIQALAAAKRAAEKAVNAAMAAAERATNKAEQAQIAHNQLTNEFRSQLSDQAATFMPRAEFELAHVSLEKLVSVNTAALSARIDSVDAKLDQEAARRAGGTSTMVTVFAIVGAIGVLVGIIGAVLGFTHL